MKKILSFFLLTLLCVGGWADDWTVSFGDHDCITVSETAADFLEVATSGDDNAHWYVLQQVRNVYNDIFTPVYDNGNGAKINRSSDYLEDIIDNGYTRANSVLKYLVRFIHGDYNDTYKIQFATGHYFATNLCAGDSASALNFLVYKINDQNGHIGINYTTDGATFGSIVDNNGAGSTLSFWGTGVVTSTGGNNDWKLYAVEIDERDNVDVTYTLKIDGETVATETEEETVGLAPRYLSPDYDVMEYIAGSDKIPEKITKDKTSYEINMRYKDSFLHSVNGGVEYTVKCRDDYYLYVKSADAKVVSLTDSVPTDLTQSYDYIWTIEGNGYQGFKLTNKLTGTHIADATNSHPNGVSAVLTDKATNGLYDLKKNSDNKWALLQHGTTGSYLSNYGGFKEGGDLMFYDVVDNGSLFIIEEVDENLRDLRTAYTKVVDYVVGDGTGEYTCSEEVKSARENASKTLRGEETASDEKIKGYISTLGSSTYTINQPVAGFYYIKNNGNGYYVKGEKSPGQLVPMQEGADKNAIFYIDSDKYIMAYENGAYWMGVYRLGVGTYNDGLNRQYKQAWEFSEGNSVGSYLLRYGTTEKYYATGSTTTTGYSSSVPTADNGSWQLVAVTDLPITIGTNGWSTFSAPVDVALPDGVQAYYVNSNPSGGSVLLTEVEGAVPANQGIIVKGVEGETVNFSTEVDGGVANLADNKLVANVDGNNITGTANDGIYAFATNKNVEPYVTGFMKLLTTVELSGHKCYLKTGTSASAAQFMPILLVDDDLTGVDSAETLSPATTSTSAIYDLQGRKVNSVVKGRIYIRNGKAFIAY